jgi:hypothetical protein
MTADAVLDKSDAVLICLGALRGEPEGGIRKLDLCF